MTKEIKVRLSWTQRILLGAGFTSGAFLEYLEAKGRLLEKAGDLVDTFGFILGLELASLAIVAALPIESWLKRLKQKDIARYSDTIKKIKDLPGEYHIYTIAQLAAVVPVLVLKFWTPDSGTAAACIASGVVVLAAMVVFMSLWQSFHVMRILASYSFERFED